MNGYYWKGTDGWYFRENKKSQDFIGPYPSRNAAADERLERLQNYRRENQLFINVNKISGEIR